MQIFRFLRRKTVEFGECERGIAFVEFALSISVLLILFLGSVEISRFVLIVQKLEKTVSTISDIVTQTDPATGLSNNTMSAMMGAIPNMMNPYPFNTNGVIIITDIVANPSGAPTPTVKWQYCGGNSSGSLPPDTGSGSSAHSLSHVTPSVKSGTPAKNTTAILPTGFTMANGEEVVIGEIFYNFTPLVSASSNLVGATTLYRSSIYMPRLGALSSYASTIASPPSTCP